MRLFLAVCWLIILAVAMLTPGTKLPEVNLFDFQDKAVHLATFFIQGYLWSGVGIKKHHVAKSYPRIWKNFLVYGILVGVILELLQQFIPNRSFDLMDMTVNAIGASLGLVTYIKWPFIKIILE